MKILYVIHDNKKGGAALSFLEMSGEIRKKHEIYVITPHKSGYIPDQLKKRGDRYSNAHYFAWLVARDHNKIVSAIRFVVYAILCRINRIEAFRIAYKLKGEHFDIVHTNASTTNFGALLAKKIGAKHVWHIREAADYIDFMPVINHRKMGAFFYNNSDQIICISEFIKIYMQNWMKEGVSEFVDKTVRIYNGVETSSVIEKHEYPVEGSTINFLISGNVSHMKGHWDLLMAVKDLISSGYKNRFHVYVAGRNDEKSFADQIMEYQLEEHFTLLGCIDNMSELRLKTDVEIVATSLEAFGRVTIEAMRASNPVIGSASGGTLELITDGKNGLLFEPHNSKELANCMKQMIDEPKRIQRMGKSAFAFANSNFTPLQNANAVCDIYKMLINENKKYEN